MVPINKRIIAIKYIRTSQKKENDWEIVKEILTEYELIVDSSEQSRERPGDYALQEE